MSSGSPNDADGWSKLAATPTIGSVIGNGLLGSGVLKDTFKTVLELMILWMVSRS